MCYGNAEEAGNTLNVTVERRKFWRRGDRVWDMLKIPGTR